MKTRRFLLLLLLWGIGIYPALARGENATIQSGFIKVSASQIAPLTLAQILTGLQTQGKTPETKTLAARNKFIAERVRQRGIAFELNKDREQDLRDAGAGDELLNAIREKSAAKFKPAVSTEAKAPPPKELPKGDKKCLQDDLDCQSNQLTKQIQSNPNNADLYARRAEIYCKIGKTRERGISDYTKAISLNPDPEYYFKRGLAYRFYGDKTNEAYDDLINALNLYNERVNLKPSAENYYKRGLVMIEMGQLDVGLRDIDKALTLSPNSSEIYEVRGTVYFMKKYNHDLALKDYTKAIELNPKNDTALFNRGNIYASRGRWQEALNDYTKAIEIEPNAMLYSMRAGCYRKLGDDAKADADRKKATELLGDANDQ